MRPNSSVRLPQMYSRSWWSRSCRAGMGGWVIGGAGSKGDPQLAGEEGLGKAVRRVAFDAAQAGDRLEGVAGEPGTRGLAREAIDQRIALVLQLRGRQRHEDVGNAQVSIELGDLV